MTASTASADLALPLPVHRSAYYGGAWHDPASGAFAETLNPSTGESIGRVAVSGAADVDAAVAAAKHGFIEWRAVPPLERAKILRRIAQLLRENAGELALIDAANCGNPVREMASDAMVAAAQIDFFAGLVTEMKGSSIPMGPDVVNFSVREPVGVVVRIVPFNHPFMFAAGKSAAPLAAGNAVTIKPLLLELGGKNALIAYPDADPDEVAAAVIGGMNFTWCGQSCGSTSRAFIHASIYDTVLARIRTRIAFFKPGLATDPATTMGAIVSRAQLDRVLAYIEAAKREGARLLCGGKRPSDPRLAAGFFVEPTVFVDVKPTMRIAREEIFGPVLAVLPWSAESGMLDAVNGVEYGLTCSIWTNDLSTAHRTAMAVQAGYVWINEVGKHFLGAPFGGVKQSGFGREECLEEMLRFTQEKNIHVKLRPTVA